MSYKEVMTGRFEGYYYTRQKRPLDISEFLPSDDTHKVHVYRGELYDTQVETQELPPGQPPRDALCLPNVKNIQVHPSPGTPFFSASIAEFTNVVFQDIDVVESWELNGKTYAFFKATFSGELKLSNEDTSSRMYPNDSTSKWSSQGGRRGNCFNWIGLFTIFSLLLFSVNFCSGGFGCDVDSVTVRCAENNKWLKRENRRLRNLNDSLSTVLEKVKLDAKLKKLASRIYFYGNEDRIREYSRGAIQDLATFMRKNPGYRIRIEGHNNPTAEMPEHLYDLDIRRAKTVKALLQEKGIAEKRMFVIGRGGSEPIVPTDQFDLDPKGFQYNNNMRVELKIIE